VYARAEYLAAVSGDLAARARWINEVAQPDAVISLHINASKWPDGELKLVEANNLHVLIFGCMTASEMESASQIRQFRRKLSNRSAGMEQVLGLALAESLSAATDLPAYTYSGLNAVEISGSEGYLWARNLMLLRSVECPSVLLEPYIANSEVGYRRLQSALKTRALGEGPEVEDILVEYADAVVAGVLKAYGTNTALPLDE